MTRIALFAALGAGCSAMGLFDGKYVTEPCASDEDCRQNRWAGDACVVVACDTAKGQCVGVLADADGDGHAPPECGGHESGFSGTPDDCDDADAEVMPGAPERCNAVDDDCDGSFDEDATGPDLPHASEACVDGVWGVRACDDGFADCSAEDGCETDTASPTACAACGCAPGEVCPGGECPLSPFVEISLGCEHTCARRESGAVVCWGANGSGQIEADGPALVTEPLVTTSATDAIEVSAGAMHTCAVRSAGSATCWGDDETHQLGDLAGLSDAVAISAGTHHTCAELVDGEVDCWGEDLSGQLGDGTAGGERADPQPVFDPGVGTPIHATDLAAASGRSADAAEFGRHTCAIVDSQVLCWGRNSVGQLGNGGGGDSATIVLVTGATQAIDVAACGTWSCAVFDRSPSEVRCWGQPAPGEGGDVPGAPIGAVANPSAVAIGLHHGCALSDGRVDCWGDDALGQIGNGGGPSPGFDTATRVLNLTNVERISAGCEHTCALVRPTADDPGEVWCWGSNSSGQLGDGGSGGSSAEPVEVMGLR